MKVIIAGSRSIKDYDILLETIKNAKFEITEVICGGAVGVDSLGERWAKENNISIKKFLPDWKSFGKGAGPIRNKQMILEGKADCLILIWDRKSRGSKNMREQAIENKLKIYEAIYGHTK